MFKAIAHNPFWKTYGLLLARIIMGGVFIMASYFKFQDINGTAMYISNVGFPIPLILAWVAAFFELTLGLAIIFGVWFSEAALLLGVYAIFLGFAFHGPSLWKGNRMEFGFFVDHFVMFAGLLYMAGHGVGNAWSLKKS